ncbi:MAG: sialate O-acetylesterase [Candidatus Nanopelagicaceae bacterium]
MASLTPIPKLQFFDANGNPLVGGKLYTYAAGTTTPLATYTDSTGASANTNPVILDSRGEANVWLEDAQYKFVLQDANSALIWTVDNINTADAPTLAAQAAAEAAAAAAQLAEVGAETARDSSWVNNRIYATTAAGIAATSSGQYFSVPAALNDEYLILYLNNAGVANEIKRYPSVNAIAPLKSTPVPDAVYAVQDNSSSAAMVVESDGDFLFSSIDSDKVNGISRFSLNKATRSNLNFTASLVHHISYGQSLSLGNGNGVQTLSNVDDGFFDSVMFNANGTTSAGPRAQEGSGTAAQNHASLIAYKEQPVSGTAPNGNFETPLGNALRMVKRLLRDENDVLTTDFSYVLLGSAPGQSNTTISGLSKGQVPYTNLTTDVTYGLARAQAAGNSYAVDAIYWSQGEADITAGTSRATYLASLLQLYTDLNTDIKAITGQSHNIKLICYQCSTYNQTNPNIALAQLDAAKSNSNIILSTAVYATEHLSSTNVHLAPVGYAMLGAYYGLTAKRTIVDGETWNMLYPTRITRQGTILDVEFPDTGYDIALSNALFPTVSNSGFTAVDGGSVDNPVVSVSVSSPKRLKIVLTNAVAGKLRYGFSSWGGNLHNLCDINPSVARDLPMYQPGLIFEESFS